MSCGFLILVTDFLMQWLMHSSMRSKKQGHPDKILVPWDVYEVDQEFAVESLLLSVEDPGHDPGIGWLSSSPWGWLRLCWWLYGR